MFIQSLILGKKKKKNKAIDSGSLNMLHTCSRSNHLTKEMDHSELSFLHPENNQGQNSFWSDVTTSAPLSANSISSDAPSLIEDNLSVISDFSTIISSPPFPTVKLFNSHDESLSTTTFWPKISTCLPIKKQIYQHSQGEGLSTRVGNSSKLMRQNNFIDSLVDSSSNIVEAIWPLSVVPYKNAIESKGIIPLREFIHETLYRSGTSYSTLQVTLYYLILIKPHVLKQEYVMSKNLRENPRSVLLCGRRMFISALILASKYLQDRNFTVQAWSRISGLDVKEINRNEITFLLAVNWQLHITEKIFQKWTQILLKYFSMPHPSISIRTISCGKFSSHLKSIIIGLNPQLDNIQCLVKSSITRKICSPYSPCYEFGTLGQKNVCFNFSEPYLTTYQSIPKFLEPLSSGYAINRSVSDHGLLTTAHPNLQNSFIHMPSYSALSELIKSQTGSQSNLDSLKALKKHSTQVTAQSNFTFGLYASPQNNIRQSLISDTSSAKQMNLSNSKLNSSSLKSFICPTSYFSSLMNTSCPSIRCKQNWKRRRIIELNKMKLNNGNINVIKSSNISTEAIGEDFIGLCSDTCMGRSKIEKNHKNWIEVLNPLKISDQYLYSVDSGFGNSPYTDFSNNRHQHGDLLGESHILLSKKRSGSDFIHFPSICGKDETTCNYTSSNIIAPRKRGRWDFDASSLFNKNIYPTMGTMNSSNF
ncbi:G1/S-specific cyclin pas1 [Erysiphe necator]|nr:G1/S-specific cyclin pas1 [Erysiphe necator]